MKNGLFIAALCAALAVVLGAFGAHALKSLVVAERLPIFETGVRYQFYHAFALFVTGLMAEKHTEKSKFWWASVFFILGMVCFSGSLYLLACRDLLPFSVFWAGPVTPLGGLCFLAGWVMLFMGTRE